ncbi:hypothetical protein [Caballeronia sp. SL2Y3]|uniref:hypothetical protein n=1 Tax=Caballeronia sp. SL2Y3 TaxID=2878151 RepID=UPI00351D6F49
MMYDFDRDSAIVYLRMEYQFGQLLSRMLRTTNYKRMPFSQVSKPPIGPARLRAYAGQPDAADRRRSTDRRADDAQLRFVRECRLLHARRQRRASAAERACSRQPGAARLYRDARQHGRTHGRAPAPLFDAPRPDSEAKPEYLRAVDKRLAALAARYGRERVAVDIVQITTQPKK